jgi:hypothetical protein
MYLREQVDSVVSASASPSGPDIDADFAFALKLQEKLDLEIAQEEEARRSRLSNGLSLIASMMPRS